MGLDASLIIETFQYPSGRAPMLPSWDGLVESWPVDGANLDPAKPASTSTEKVIEETRESSARAAEVTRRNFEAGRQQGILEGRAAERDAQSAGNAARERGRMEQAARLIETFAAERDRYLSEVEHEVVELALAVAARILRREAQMDPLLLTGAVRVALGQLSASTEVRLLVPPSELELWAETMAHMPNLAVRPEVVAGDGMRLGDCIIETGMGSVDIGIRAQLGEIEHGFFDRAGSPKTPDHPVDTGAFGNPS